jgi:WD40 repeat protein
VQIGGGFNMPQKNPPRPVRGRTPPSYLAAACQDRSVRVWDISSHRVQILLGHDGVVTIVAFRPDGQYLASSGADGLVILWDVKDPKMVKAQRRILAHRDRVAGWCSEEIRILRLPIGLRLRLGLQK